MKKNSNSYIVALRKSESGIFNLEALLRNNNECTLLVYVTCTYIDSLTLFQWSVVGDTFPVGCAFSDQIVFGLDSFKDNPDIIHEIYR